MFKAIAQFFDTITIFLLAISKFMNAFLSLASTAENTAKTFEQEEAINNEVKLRDLRAKAANLDVNNVFGDFDTEEKKH